MLVPFYGEEIPCLMYASNWRLREQGVGQFKDGMKNAVEKSMDPKDESAAILEQSIKAGSTSLTRDQRLNLAFILNMTEVLKDKV